MYSHKILIVKHLLELQPKKMHLRSALGAQLTSGRYKSSSAIYKKEDRSDFKRENTSINVNSVYNIQHKGPGIAISAYFHHLATQTKPKDLKYFYTVLPSLIKDFENSEIVQNLPVVKDNYKRVVEHQLSPCTQFSTLHLLAANRHFESAPVTKSEHQQEWKQDLKLHMTSILGWCIEMINGAYDIHDDVVSCSPTRFGRPSWVTVREQGQLGAMNDVFLLEKTALDLIRKHFKKDHLYLYGQLMDLFSHVLQSYTLANAAEAEFVLASVKNGRQCSMEEYMTITGIHYGSLNVYLPIATAAVLNGRCKSIFLKRLERACFEVVVHGYMVRDFIDVYLDLDLDLESSDLGNIYTKENMDISNGNMSWLFLTAMKHGTTVQRQILAENYGKNIPGNVTRVKKIYEEIGIRKYFKEWEENYYKNTTAMIASLPPEFPKQHLTFILNVPRSLFKKIL